MIKREKFYKQIRIVQFEASKGIIGWEILFYFITRSNIYRRTKFSGRMKFWNALYGCAIYTATYTCGLRASGGHRSWRSLRPKALCYRGLGALTSFPYSCTFVIHSPFILHAIPVYVYVHLFLFFFCVIGELRAPLSERRPGWKASLEQSCEEAQHP